MNYYHRYSGDYIKKTLDLVMVEDGAYTRLLDWMYANERPVPHDKRHIITRCQSPVERKAVDAVLDQFFHRDGDCWTHERAQETIDEARPRIEAAQANGKKGGRPKGSKKKPTGLFEENPDQTQSESSPYTIPHTTPPSVPSGGAAPKRPTRKCPADFVVTTDLQDWAAENHPGVDLMTQTASFRDYTFKTAMTDWPATWRNWIRKAAEFAGAVARPGPAPGNKQQALEDQNRQVAREWAERMKGQHEAA